MINDKYKILTFVLVLIISVSIQGCKEEKKRDLSDNEIIQYKDPIIGKNIADIRRNKELIESYIKRHQWEMTETDQGLWYEIYVKGDGQKAEENKVVTISFEISLLNGQLCYSSDSLGLKSFIIGKGGIEAGLNQGIMFCHQGDKARFIVPPHLAFGLVGDDNKIPMDAVVIYDIEILIIEDGIY